MRPRRMVRSSVTSNSDRPMVGKKQWRTKNTSVGRRPGLNDRLCDGRASCEWNERRAQSPALPGTARMLMLRGKRRNLIGEPDQCPSRFWTEVVRPSVIGGPKAHDDNEQLTCIRFEYARSRTHVLHAT